MHRADAEAILREQREAASRSPRCDARSRMALGEKYEAHGEWIVAGA